MIQIKEFEYKDKIYVVAPALDFNVIKIDETYWFLNDENPCVKLSDDNLDSLLERTLLGLGMLAEYNQEQMDDPNTSEEYKQLIKPILKRIKIKEPGLWTQIWTEIKDEFIELVYNVYRLF